MHLLGSYVELLARERGHWMERGRAVSRLEAVFEVCLALHRQEEADGIFGLLADMVPAVTDADGGAVLSGGWSGEWSVRALSERGAVDRDSPVVRQLENLGRTTGATSISVRP